MHSKKDDNNKTQYFIQGLRPFSSTIPVGLKKIFKKKGYNFSNIVDNWTKMVGEEISSSTYPDTIKTGKGVDNGTLILNVVHGKELDIEYKKKDIIDKINSFFGYTFISKIKLKIIHKKIIEKKRPKNFEKNIRKFTKKLETIENNKLKNSLNNLLEAYNEKDN